MQNFHRLAVGINVEGVKLQLHLHPELWNMHQDRKNAPGSPHAGMSDIWVRWREKERGELPFMPAWLPAWHSLAALRPIVFGLMSAVNATFLGGVLITRIPPGGVILPHNDRGTWHAEYMNVKLYVPIASNSSCVNVCESETVVMGEGEAWYFDNLREHSVENHGDTERITLIVCMRVE